MRAVRWLGGASLALCHLATAYGTASADETCAALQGYIAAARQERGAVNVTNSLEGVESRCARAHRIQNTLRAELKIIDADAGHCGYGAERIAKMKAADERFYYHFSPGC